MKCVNKDCENEQDVDDLTICWMCYEYYYLEQRRFNEECLQTTIQRLVEE